MGDDGQLHEMAQPEEDGWYWVQFPNGNWNVGLINSIKGAEKTYRCLIANRLWVLGNFEGYRFFGPLKPPEVA